MMNHIHTCPSLVLKLFTLGITLCGQAVPYVEYALIDEEFRDPDIDLTSGLELFESVSAAVMTFSIQLEKFVTINFTSSSHILNASMRSSVTVSLHFYRAMHFSAKRGIGIACRLSVRPSVCDVGEL